MNEVMKYARLDDGELIKARKRMNTEQYFHCVSCQEKVIVVNDDPSVSMNNVAHFEHTKGRGLNCDYAGYVNHLSAEKFKNFYVTSKELIIIQNKHAPCERAKDLSCAIEMKVPLDLKKIYPMARLIKDRKRQSVDCVLYNDEESEVFIEINYETVTPAGKISRGIPIIEITIDSQECLEEFFFNKKIEEDNSKVYLYNFAKIPLDYSFDCFGKCVIEEEDDVVIKMTTICEVVPETTNERIIEQREREEIKKAELAILNDNSFTEEEKEEPIEKKKLFEIGNNRTIIPKPEIAGNTRVQLFRPKVCFDCEDHPIRYMNVGNIEIDKEYNILDIVEDTFNKEILDDDIYSIAKRVDIEETAETSKTNGFYCPECGGWIANNRMLRDSGSVYDDEMIIVVEKN